jgi:sugar/nucleoside kinase (ribokinase family)
MNRKQFDVLCVGQLTVDILVKPVDCVDFGIDTQRVDLIETTNGGDCLNVAMGLSKLGNRVGIVGKIGRDPFGELLIDVMDRAGIDRTSLRRTPEAPTCSVLTLINSTGDRTFFYHGGANDYFSPDDFDIAIVERARIVHVGGTYLLPRFDGIGAEKLLSSARAAGKLTSMDVTWDVSGRWLETIQSCLPYLGFFMPSSREAEKITGQSTPPEMAEFLRNLGVDTVVIKLGKNGCYVKTAEEEGFFVDALEANVVDTTGAGDSFVAGFLTGVLRNWDIHSCARFACGVAALNIQHVGATTGVPTFDQAFRFIQAEDRNGQ